MDYMKQEHKDLLKRHGYRDAGDGITKMRVYGGEVLLTGRWRTEVRPLNTHVLVEVAWVKREKVKAPWWQWRSEYHDVVHTDWVSCDEITIFEFYPIQECSSLPHSSLSTN